MRVSTVVDLGMALVATASLVLVERVVSSQLEKQASVRSGMAAEKLMISALHASSRISTERGPANRAHLFPFERPEETVFEVLDRIKLM